MGSPPRGRGTQVFGFHALEPDGLTPAWAGNTSFRISRHGTRRAHPRVGGEHNSVLRNAYIPWGSPPRGRGTRTRTRCTRPATGLTPAWAGNTSSGRRPISSGRAHPRVGGEHVDANALIGIPAGSPPRGRGTPHHRSDRGCARGLTPAWAGNTIELLVDLDAGAGSPPRGRGTRCRRRRLAAPCRAHRRVGGEHTGARRRTRRAGGSPPRGRGTRARPPHGPLQPGLTPAWAGNTRPRCLG